MPPAEPVYDPAPIAPEHLEGDQVARGDPRFGIVWINPQRLGGRPCFYGTRIPVQNLFDYLEAGEPLAEFLRGFPDITREHALAVLAAA